MLLDARNSYRMPSSPKGETKMKKANRIIIAVLVVALIALTCATLVACNEKTYTVSFTGESVSIATQTVKDGALAVEPEDPTREHYTFGGWLLNGAEYSFDTPVKADIVLTAKWDRKIFTVTFGGDSVTTPAQSVYSGDTAQEPAKPQRENYDFGGWFNGDEEYDFDTPVTANVDLEAHWDPKQVQEPTQFNVTFAGEGVTTPAQSILDGETAMEPATPVRDGYKFMGWFNGDAEYDFDTPVTDDIELTAHWKAYHAVTFAGDGITTPAQSILDGETATEPVAPVRNGYKFMGWLNGDEEYDFDTPVTAPVELTANWKAYHTVSFTGDGVNIPTQSIFDGETATEPSRPVRDNYRFTGWLFEGSPYDFDSPVTSDIVLTADWLNLGDGTSSNPYMLYTANDIQNFAARINNPEGNEEYLTAYFRLGADIDMSGLTNFTSIGVTSYENEDGDTVYCNGFEGVFDGNGHKISNVTITRNLRSGIARVGFFATTYMALIKDVTFENINYTIEAGADINSIGAYFGGVVAYAGLTQFSNVQVSGAMTANLFASNIAYIGGIAGNWDNTYYETEEDKNKDDDEKTAYIVFVENTYANVSIKAGTFSDGSSNKPSLESAIVGGLFGNIKNDKNAAAIINSATAGEALGGQATGGLIGVIRDDKISIINCISTMTVRTTAKEASSYAGGLIGLSNADAILLDSAYSGVVRGSKPTNPSQMGYAGALIGYAVGDRYDRYFTAGTTVINCYYKAAVSNANRTTVLGASLAAEPTLDWAVTTLNWDAASWQADENGNFIPTDVLIGDLRDTATVTLENGSVSKEVVRPITGAGGFKVIGVLADAQASAETSGMVFWDWEHQTGELYKYYMPIVKDLTLTAYWQDVADIVGIYSGVSEFHGTSDAGILQLKDDGTLQWLASDTNIGKYKYNGQYIVIEFYSGHIGGFSGTLEGDVLHFYITFGSSEYEYTFTKSDLAYFGEYYSETGDLLTFTGEDKLTFNSILLDTDNINGTFTEVSANTLQVGGALSNYFSSMTITVNEDYSLQVNFVGKNSYPSFNTRFAKVGAPDYSDRAFVGKYAVAWLAGGEKNIYQDLRQIILNADGSAESINAYGAVIGSYYAFGNTIRLLLEGNISTFTYDEDAGILHGIFNRGMNTFRNLIAPKIADDTALKDMNLWVYVIDGSRDDAVYVTDDTKHVMRNGVYQPNAAVVGEFTGEDTFVTVDGVRYIARFSLYNSYYTCYSLSLVGEEEGVYTYNGKQYAINGIGEVACDTINGIYKLYGNYITVLMDDDELFVFDYTEAQAANNVITLSEHDGYQGVWYYDNPKVSVNLWLDENTQDNKKTEIAIEKYYKFVVDGFGHTTLIYYSYDYQEYRYNWSSVDNGWGIYSLTPTGIRTWYNDSQISDFVFYYDMGLAYTRKFGGTGGEMAFYAEGYNGSMQPPSLPDSLIGSFIGEEEDGTSVVFNLKSDVTGSYKGVPFIAVYDGNNQVRFTIGAVQYVLKINESTLYYSGEAVELTKSGEITEVIPAMYCGEWSGQVDGLGGVRGATVAIDTSGQITYTEGDTVITFDATFDLFNMQINGVSGENTIKLVYDLYAEVFKLEVKKGDYPYTGDLTKAQ